MSPSLWFFAAWLVGAAIYIGIFAGVDYAFARDWLPGGTVTRNINRLSKRHPLLWHAGYLALAGGVEALLIYGYTHFFGW